MTPDSNQKMPDHIAIIMDGNNRWAQSKGLPIKAGHRRGAETARDIAYSCINRNISYLTLFAFSSENWMRPQQEVQGLMALFLSVLRRHEIKQLHKDNVCLKFIGRRSAFSQKLQDSMAEAEELTAANTGTTVIVAADYGGRWDIVQAAQAAAAKVAAGELNPQAIDVDLIHSLTSLSGYPEPDLCIRTGGEHRISNFLLWQFAYTEFYFCEQFWPDFDEEQFELALRDYASRKRRYGGHDEQVVIHE